MSPRRPRSPPLPPRTRRRPAPTTGRPGSDSEPETGAPPPVRPGCRTQVPPGSCARDRAQLARLDPSQASREGKSTAGTADSGGAIITAQAEQRCHFIHKARSPGGQSVRSAVNRKITTGSPKRLIGECQRRPPPTPCRCLRRIGGSEERLPARGPPSSGGAVSAPAVSDTRAECKTTLRSRPPPPPPPGIILGQITRDISRQADPPLRLRQAAVKIGFAEVAQPPGERSGSGGGVKRGAGPRRAGMARGCERPQKKKKRKEQGKRPATSPGHRQP
ncbi:serine/arginine repetitive matrix protein 1-like [Schistocerca piceifrons]|uniref:serine/arginine repetitive matrix protein 1-like n=1 Tax=Schistocerca piceifrons TaxID=274613 RepID=UPI001F5EA76D|nr:serine/arginine repetitive matrix protein 1-like [Schistocerca piceifrons]